MTTLTVVVVAVVVYGALSRRGYGVALALGGATPAGAAVVAGDTAVPTFYAVAVGAAVGLLLRLLERTRADAPEVLPQHPAARPLLLLLVVGVLVTLVAPYLFEGQEVLNSEGQVNRLSAGFVSSSNLAQMIYLALGVAVVAHLAHARWAGPQLVGLAAGLTTLLSAWAWLGTSAGVPFPVGFFDNSPTFRYIATEPGGLPRVRGILSEPSSLATTCLVTIAYTASRFNAVSGLRRLGTVALLLVALFLGAISTSATFFVAGAALLLVASVVAGVSLLVRQQHLGRKAVVVFLAVAVAALWLLPVAANLFGAVISDKVTSSSYDDRSSADSRAYRFALDTIGFGTGLGSNRASSFFPGMLSTVGVVGTLLFVATVWLLLRRTAALPEVRPAAWTLVTVLVCKVISGPDLGDSSGVLWLSLGVLAHAAVRAQQRSVEVGPAPERVSERSSSPDHGASRR